MEKITLLCLFGGKSTEHDVSLVSAYSILKNADRSKYNIETVGITKEGDWYYYSGEPENIRDGSWHSAPALLENAAISPSVGDSALIVFSTDGSSYRKIHVDVIFPVMHGAFSEDGTMQGLLQISGIPFVGCKCTTSALAMDKAFTKLLMKNLGIPQARSMIVRAESIEANYRQILEGCEKLSPYPLFIKPANAGSSVGASKVTGRDKLKDALYKAAKFDSKVIIEEFIKGKECEVAVIGKNRYTASTVGQIIPGCDFYDYETKYSSSSPATYRIPADIKPETALELRTAAIKICSILGVEGLSRVDFFVRKSGENEEIIFNEINTIPGFTEISMYPKLFIHDGMSYSEIIDRLIDIALGKRD